jgi:hypothetical protein
VRTKATVCTKKRRRKLSRLAVMATGLLAGTLPMWTAPAGAATTATPVVTLVGSTRTLPTGSATVVVEAELALHVNAAGVPQTLEDVPVATQTITTAGFSVPVPASATLDQAEQQGRGNVNFDIIVTSGTGTTSRYVPARLTPAATSSGAAAISVQAAKVVRVPTFPAFRTVSATALLPAAAPSAAPDMIPAACVWSAYGSLYQARTRIGEVHVANAPGVTDTFWYRNQNDLTITVGISVTVPDSGYNDGGTITLTNSLQAGGSATFPAGTVTYVDDTVNYQRYEAKGITCPNGPSAYAYKVQAVSTDSDVYPGLSTPPANPWAGGCRNDPLHVMLGGAGVKATWDLDHSSAAYYSSIANLFGFTFGGSDGFTTDVEHQYSSSASSPRTYICGPKNGLPPIDAPVLYNTP